MGVNARIADMNDEHGVYGAARVEAGNGGLPKISIETKLGNADVYVY